MRLSSKGYDLIKSFEGCLKPVGGGMFVPYICPAGVLTIGWGHTNDGGRPFNRSARWSQAECDQALVDDMVRYEKAVDRRVKVQLTQGQYDALVSFTYNCGEGALAKSTLLRLVNARRFNEAARAFAAWNRGGGKVLKGLTRRRAAEAALFLEEDYAVLQEANYVVSVSDDDEPMAQRVDYPPEKPAISQETAGGVTVATGSATAVVQQAQESLAPLSHSLSYLVYVLLALTLTGLGITIYSIIKTKRAKDAE